MFQRYAFGSFGPFQSWGSAINPFQYGIGANPFLQFAGGISPLQQGAGLLGQVQPLGGPLSFNPPGAALNPFVSQTFLPQPLGLTGASGVSPGGFGFQLPGSQYGYGVWPINPYGGQPYGGQAGGLGSIN